jgi:SAM-dependent methyltransferase
MYDALAAVYEFTVPEALLSPEGSFAAFRDVVGGLPPGAAVLDCACGTGTLAVGLAQAGLAVTATDASAAMTERTAALAAAHGIELDVATVAWEALGAQGWDGRFAAVLCVGNALTHTEGAHARRAALANMAGVLAPGGRLAVAVALLHDDGPGRDRRRAPALLAVRPRGAARRPRARRPARGAPELRARGRALPGHRRRSRMTIGIWRWVRRW